MRSLQAISVISCFLVGMASAPSAMAVCASSADVAANHVATRLLINTTINAMSAAIVAALQSQTAQLEKAITGSGQATVNAISGANKVAANLTDAQTSEIQRVTQDQTSTLAALLSNTGDLIYGKPSNGRQISPHAADACEVAILSAGATGAKTGKDNFRTTVNTESSRHFGGKSFTSRRAQDAWVMSRRDDLFVLDELIRQDGVMALDDANKVESRVRMFLDPEPIPLMADTITAAYPDSEATAQAEIAINQRAGNLALASAAISRSLAERIPTMPVDAATEALYPLWDWDSARDPSTGNTSPLEMLKLRAQYDFGNPEFERDLSIENQKALLARLNRQMAVSNYIAFERLTMEREAHIVSMKSYADDIRQRADTDVIQRVLDANAQGAR